MIVRLFLIALMVTCNVTYSATAQNLFLKNELKDAVSSAPKSEEPVAFRSFIQIQKGTNQGLLHVEAKIESGWNVYAMTQPKGGPIPSEITIKGDGKLKLAGEFTCSKKPTIKKTESFDVPVESLAGTVVWTAPVELAQGVDPEQLSVDLSYRGMVCQSGDGGVCKPLFGIKIKSTFSEFKDRLVFKTEVPVKVEPFQPGELHCRLTGVVVGANGKPIQPGDTVELKLTAKTSGKYHVYKLTDAKADYMPTRIGFTQWNNWKIGQPKSSIEPFLDTSLGTKVEYYKGDVTWVYQISIPKDAELKAYAIEGLIGLQTCDDSQCDPPAAAKFSVSIELGKTQTAPITFDDGSYSKSKKAQAAFAEATSK